MRRAKYIAGGVAVLVAVFGLSWGLEYLGIVRMGIFAPMRADVQRQVFEETQSFNHGMVQQLAKHRLEYMREGDPISKAAIASAVRTQFAAFDIESVAQAELREFWYEINR